MNQRSDQKAESRTKIVEAAARNLRERGLSGTSVDRAMRGAGLTVGAFYAHFRSKDELLSHAFAAAMDEMEGVMRRAAGGGTGRAVLIPVSTAYLSERHREAAHEGCPLPAVAGEAASSRDPGTHERVARGLSTLRDRLVALGGGEIDPPTALALCGLLVGGQILARATRGTPLSDELLAACRAAAVRLLRPDGP
ncbi:MAG: TetR/AcrR family transcriptional regulator [Myxococcota bacterium]